MSRHRAQEVALLDRWQHGFPLTERPFAAIGQQAGLDECEVIDLFARLQENGTLSRIGAVVTPHTVGASTLGAMRVPDDRLADVAQIVSAEPLVNHNYERTNAFNLWFVVAGPDIDAVTATIRRIERDSGLRVLDLPLLQAFHIDLGFSLTGQEAKQRSRRKAQDSHAPDSHDRRLLAAIENGLPFVSRPYRSVAERIGLDEQDVLGKLALLAERGIVKRFGCVVRHRALGYTANAMAVWDTPDDHVERVGGLFAANPNVTLCYRRRRHLPEWPYNLYCMVHAKTPAVAYAAVDELNLIAGAGLLPQALLFSRRCFKQRGAVLSEHRGF